MIINNLASIVNNMIINLYSANIKFYHILIGLFLVNIITYYLCKLISENRRIKFN